MTSEHLERITEVINRVTAVIEHEKTSDAFFALLVVLAAQLRVMLDLDPPPRVAQLLRAYLEQTELFIISGKRGL